MNTSEFHDAYEDKERIRGLLLSSPISELTLNAPFLVEAGDTVGAAVKAMIDRHIGCVLVQKAGKLVGIFTERDVMRRVVMRDNGMAAKVESMMTPQPETLEPTATIAFALNKMSLGGFRHIPIVDRTGKPTGVLSVRDIVDFLVELYPEEVMNLPSSPDKAVPMDADGG
jgi:CBS domain-containing protein